MKRKQLNHKQRRELAKIRKVKRKLLGEAHTIRADARVNLYDWWKSKSEAPCWADWAKVLTETFDEYTPTKIYEAERAAAETRSETT